ncbi:MAG: hypothetical protein SFW36_04100 [Leptolyngbyaceae cyanobacterium bins.59]|nr:hypothetical protein [Leptolyngbyaceae cyanobacterium bins.59]
MAALGRLRRYYINLGGGVADVGAIKWGFRAPNKAYKNIGAGLGVTEVKDNNTAGITYGANKPVPARVRIHYIDAQLGGGEGNDIIRTASRYCEYDKLNGVLFGSINGKKIFMAQVQKEFDIESVTLINR